METKSRPFEKYLQEFQQTIGPVDCWPLPHKATIWNGYVTVCRSVNGKTKTYRAHRLAYELLVGPIPPGLSIDHLCNNRICVNPSHLKAVSVAENVLRAETGRSAMNARKTHCLRGHPFAGENLRLKKRQGGRNGYSRTCWICTRAQNIKDKRAKAARMKQ